jgi:predicted N-formylglutamate amidohydrolase
MQQLLVPGDPPPFSVHNEQGKAPVLLLCDHASKAVPEALGNLGISQAELSRHIGWDIGGLDAAIALAEALDAPLIASGYSRLVIDCNRWPGGEGSTPEISDGTPVPANKGLTKEQVDARAEACFWPYHREVDRHLDRMTAGGAKVALLVMHSSAGPRVARPLQPRQTTRARAAAAPNDLPMPDPGDPHASAGVDRA